MLYVVPVRKSWQKKVPAINHVDNTARPQLVYGDENPLYFKLITAFYKKTGVPLLLNTSFNLKGEPIVNSPADAYSTFIRSGIDILAIMAKKVGSDCSLNNRRLFCVYKKGFAALAAPAPKTVAVEGLEPPTFAM